MGRTTERVCIIVRYPQPFPVPSNYVHVQGLDQPIIFSTMDHVQWREENAVNIYGYALLNDTERAAGQEHREYAHDDQVYYLYKMG